MPVPVLRLCGVPFHLAENTVAARSRAKGRQHTCSYFSCQTQPVFRGVPTVVEQVRRGMLVFQMHDAVFYRVLAQQHSPYAGRRSRYTYALLYLHSAVDYLVPTWKTSNSANVTTTLLITKCAVSGTCTIPPHSKGIPPLLTYEGKY
jgi:hypothetical protein